MTIEELHGEALALEDFRQWLLDKLVSVDIDLAANQQEQEDILNDMGGEYGNGC